VSRDVGLLSLENSLDTPLYDPTRELSVRRLDQNAAQRAALERIGGREGLGQQIASRRDQWADVKVPQIFGDARAAGGAVSVLDSADQRIAATLRSPEGKRQTVSSVMEYVQERLDSIRRDGSPAVDSEELYAIRKDIAEVLSGKLKGLPALGGGTIESDKFRSARAQLLPVLQDIDQAIEAGVPGFQAYMQRYARMSRAAEGAELLSTVRQRATSPSAVDPRTQESLINLGGLSRAATSLSQDAGLTLPGFQREMLDRIEQDMRRGASGQSAAVAGSGSQTFRMLGGNITVANIIGRALGQQSGADQKLSPMLKPFQWLLETPEAETKALLVRAMLDPELAAKLLQQASEEAAKEAADALRAKAAYGGVASQVVTQGGILSQTPKPETP
jgi:hypothetical protein